MRDVLKHTFKVINLDSLAVGEKSMVTKMNYRKGDHAAMHQHPQEQCGYVISGRHHLIVGCEPKIDIELNAGDSYAISGNSLLSAKIICGEFF